MAKRRITGKPGLFGTVYYYDGDGNYIGKSRPGALGGSRVYIDQDGRYAGKSRPGFLAKEVFTDTDNNHITSYESLCGEVHYKNGVVVGHSKPGFFDTSYTALETEEVSGEEYEKPAYAADTPGINQQTIVRNLQLFGLSLVICMIIGCIYAIVRFN